MDEIDTNTWLIFLVTFIFLFLGIVAYALTGGTVQPGWGGGAVAASIGVGLLVAWMYRGWVDMDEIE